MTDQQKRDILNLTCMDVAIQMSREDYDGHEDFGMAVAALYERRVHDVEARDQAERIRSTTGLEPLKEWDE